MTSSSTPAAPAGILRGRPELSALITAALFVALFAQPIADLARDWWNDPDAGHGLLLAPIAVWLAWKSRPVAPVRPALRAGLVLLAGSVALRYASGLAAEVFTMRLSMVGALGGLTLYHFGWSQARRWWLPFTLLILSVPLPDVLISSIAFPLQLQASRIGARLLELRNVPVRLEGNLILLPGHQLFVTEACSGLRSLTALISLAVLAGGLWLGGTPARVALLATSIPIAVLLNGIRVFLTGFLVFFVGPEFGDGFMHMTEGWLIFLVAFLLLGGVALLIGRVERRWRQAV